MTDHTTPAPRHEPVPPSTQTRASGTPAPDATVVRPVDAPPRHGEPVAGPPGYALLGELAQGGMGVVYRARDRRLDREVAVKVVQEKFRGEPEMTRRFVAEAKITGQLQHPGVPPVHDLGELPDGSPYLAMKLIAGRTLAALLAGRPDPSHDRGRFVAVFQQVCQTVGYAHSRGIIHRDLKPANVMVGDFGEVQVMDWGLAKSVGSRQQAEGSEDTEVPVLASGGREPPDPRDHQGAHSPRSPGHEPTAVGAVMGSLPYMPPEQARGEVDRLDARSDVFGLGAVLCAILTGHGPFGGSTPSSLERVKAGDLTEAFARLEGCGADPELVGLCRRCLSPDPADRPADGGAVAAEAGAYLAGVEERLRAAEREAAAADARAEEQRKRRRVQLALAGAVGLVLAGVASFAWREDKRATADRVAEKAREDDERARRAKNDEAMAASLTACEIALRDDDADRAAAALADAERRINESSGEAFADRLSRVKKELDLLNKLDRIDVVVWTMTNGQFEGYKGVVSRWQSAFTDPQVVRGV